MTDLFVAPGTASALFCERCGATGDADAAPDECACGGTWEVRHAPPAARGSALAAQLGARRAGALPVRGEPRAADHVYSGVWRFRELVLPGPGACVSWPEGNTPVVVLPAIADFAGVATVTLKHEGMNPTGSFKDRGMTVAVSRAARAGARAIACASTGNTAASLAAYAARAGLPALVLVPDGNVAGGKLAQAAAYGARTLLVDGDFDACLSLVREASRQLGVYVANSVNPWRIEGQKTIAWELLEQLGWDPPDWIALPGGALGNTAALGKALREARALGLLAHVPRIVVVQAAGASPFADAYEAGFARRVRVQAQTVATAIRIGDPASWDRAVRAIRETDGVVVAVPDDAILEAKAAIDAAGVGCEPASAASLAGVRALRARGVIAADASVACIVTGHVLKDPDTTTAFHASRVPRANPPVRISADLRAVERAMAHG